MPKRAGRRRRLEHLAHIAIQRALHREKHLSRAREQQELENLQLRNAESLGTVLNSIDVVAQPSTNTPLHCITIETIKMDSEATQELNEKKDSKQQSGNTLSSISPIEDKTIDSKPDATLSYLRT